jgi:hypothetical protein
MERCQETSAPCSFLIGPVLSQTAWISRHDVIRELGLAGVHGLPEIQIPRIFNYDGLLSVGKF